MSFDQSRQGLFLAIDVIESQIERWASLPRDQQEAIKKHIARSASNIAKIVNPDKTGGKQAG